MFGALSQDKSDLLAARHGVRPGKVIPVGDQAAAHTGLQLTCPHRERGISARYLFIQQWTQIRMIFGFPEGEFSHKMKRCAENLMLMTFLPAAAAAEFTTRTSSSISATLNCSLCCGKPSGFAFPKLRLSRAASAGSFLYGSED